MSRNIFIKFSYVFVIVSIIFLNFGMGLNWGEAIENKKIPDVNVILVGWDGVQQSNLQNLLQENKLPAFKKYFIDKGSCSEINITSGTPQTKPGWAEILTGYRASQTLKILSNRKYAPIPKGYTVFERLENFFGDENIETIFLSGKSHNMAATGPHRMCMNCLGRDSKTFESLEWWDENSKKLRTKNGSDFIFEEREGEPYYIVHKYFDVFENALGISKNVMKKVSKYLKKFQNNSFFLFAHFEEPDPQGHLYGENSKEYQAAIIENDQQLDRLMKNLKERKIFDKTVVYLVTDHGMDKGKHKHTQLDKIFFCSSEQNLQKNGDRKDITPTILSRYDIDLSLMAPVLEGKSLLKSQ